jgi:hypothetical protein
VLRRLLTCLAIVGLMVVLSFNHALAKKDADSSPTPDTSVKVLVCHKDGQSGNYSKVDVSVHSVNDANGLNGHGNHDGDIWSPYTFEAQDYAGLGDYSNTNFDSCTTNVAEPTSSPSATPTPSPTPVDTSTPTPSATPNNFVFPSCQNFIGTPGDKAHYNFGMHQIVGGPLLPGSDDVYTLENGNFLQCFCPVDGVTGIQTNWLRVPGYMQGWFYEFGEGWNLGRYWYAAQNMPFSCKNESIPETTPAPQTSTNVQVNDGGDGLGCATHDCSGNSALEGTGTGGQVLGASVMAEAGTFTEDLYKAIMGIGATLTTIGTKGLKKGKAKRSKKAKSIRSKKASKK